MLTAMRTSQESVATTNVFAWFLSVYSQVVRDSLTVGPTRTFRLKKKHINHHSITRPSKHSGREAALVCPVIFSFVTEDATARLRTLCHSLFITHSICHTHARTRALNTRILKEKNIREKKIGRTLSLTEPRTRCSAHLDHTVQNVVTPTNCRVARLKTYFHAENGSQGAAAAASSRDRCTVSIRTESDDQAATLPRK